MNKGVGYILLVLGLVILALGVKPVNDSIVGSIPQLEGINPIILMVVGVVIIAVSVILMRGSRSNKSAGEVPIYQGKDVVGFRRMGKKR